MPKLKTPNRLSLSLANVTTDATRYDWSGDEETGAGGLGQGFEIIYPRPTLDDISEHAPDLMGKRKPSRRIAADDLAEAFREERGGSEWEAAFHPMMSAVWPVSLAYEVSAAEAAQLMAEFAPACTLVEFEDEDAIGEGHGIALNGGGMDLSDHIAAAYLCCGCVPPARILINLRGVIGPTRMKEIGGALRQAYRRAEEFQRNQGRRLAEERRSLFSVKAVHP